VADLELQPQLRVFSFIDECMRPRQQRQVHGREQWLEGNSQSALPPCNPCCLNTSPTTLTTQGMTFATTSSKAPMLGLGLGLGLGLVSSLKAPMLGLGLLQGREKRGARHEGRQLRGAQAGLLLDVAGMV